MIRWPGHVPPVAWTKNSVASGIDWLPTLCRLPALRVNLADFDGENVSAAWLGKQYTRRSHFSGKRQIPRARWRFARGPWKLRHLVDGGANWNFYNIPADPGETQNLGLADIREMAGLRPQLEQ